jgi:hypothetical protein
LNPISTLARNNCREIKILNGTDIYKMINGSIINALNILNPISLEEIEGVRLMNRVETKYIFSASKMVDLINLLKGKYKVLEINSMRVHPYWTTYMDTPDYLFYNQHIRGEFARHKIRYRKYESSGEIFLEIKKKTNKGRTVKWRLENDAISGSFDSPAISFINRHISIDSAKVKPKLNNRFNRATLISLKSDERITMDFNISFFEPFNEKIVFMPYLAIIELKRAGYSQSSCFNAIIKQLNIQPIGFSKYCMGSAILNESLKRNMIKPKLLMLNIIENEYINAYCS